MKKLLFFFAIIFGISFQATASKYKINEANVEKTFSMSTEVSFEEKFSQADFSAINNINVKGGTDRTGYLLRSFFCSFIALHRYYMGTGKKHMWAYYFCIPIVGGVTGCVDFWWSVFESDAHNKYANNDKFIVWLD